LAHTLFHHPILYEGFEGRVIHPIFLSVEVEVSIPTVTVFVEYFALDIV
jgi:hypothetical protein